MDEYESILLMKPEVFVYKIPPRTTSRGYRAADWNLGSPDWTGRMRLVVVKEKCILKLEDKSSGELFAQSPIDTYPGNALETVTDSSRYFILRIEDEGGKAAFIGLGFGDRADSFDLNVALQDHFKWLKKEAEGELALAEDGGATAKPPLDLGFKEGETIKINMKIAKKDGQDSPNSSSRAKKPAGAGGVLLPPPPGGAVRGAGGQSSPQRAPSQRGLLGAEENADAAWGEFETASSGSDNASKSPANVPNSSSGGGGGQGWVTF